MPRTTRTVRRLAAALLTAAVANPARAVDYTWNTTDGVWNVPANWVGGVAPVSANTARLFFNAADATSYTATNNVGTGTFTLNRLTVNNTGTGTVTINGAAAANTFTFAGATPTLDITGTVLFTGLMAGSATVTKVGTGTFIHDSDNAGFTGTLIVNEGTFVNRATTTAVTNFNPTSIVVNNGGTYQFGAAGVGDPNLPNSTYITVNTGGTVDWQEGEQFGGFKLFGGTIKLSAGPTVQGSTATEFQSGTITGGSAIGGAAAINKTTAGTVTITGTALNNTGGLNIQEGTISTNAGITTTGNLTFGTATTAGALQFTGAAAGLGKPIVLNAGGGTVDVTQAGTVLASSGVVTGAGRLTKDGPGTLALSGAVGHTGGTTIAAGALQIGIGGTAGSLAGDVVSNGTLAFNRSDDLTFAGAVSGTGGVSKLGANTVTLSGPLSYTGTTAVSAGTLRVAPFGTGAVTVADGATLAVVNGTTAGTFTTPTVTLGTGGSTLRFDLASAGNPSAPLLNVTATDGLVLNGGSHTLVLTNTQNFAVGQFTLIDYAGTPIAGGFTLTGLSARTFAGLVYNDANTSIDLKVTGVDTIRWTGASSADWDAGTAINTGGTLNWKQNSNGATTNFVPGDAVRFDDTAAGPAAVNLTADLQPTSVTVDNTAKNYTFSGPGGISGSAGLVKQGTGTLTVLATITATGATTVSAGTLVVGDGGTTGSIGTGDLTNTGAVVFDRSDDITLGMAISGTGSLTKKGANTLTLTAAYTATGPTTVEGGTLALSTVNPYTYTGAIGGAGGFTKLGVGVVTLAGANTYAGGTTVSAGTLQIGSGGTTGSLTGAVSLTGTTATLAFNRSDAVTFAGDLSGSGRVTQAGTGTLTLTGALTYSGITTVSAGTLQLGNGAATGPTIPGNVAVAAGATLGLNLAADLTYNGVLSGAGAVTKTDATTLTLTGASTFTGTFTINGGTVILTDPTLGAGTGGDLNATAVVVNSGGKFQFGLVTGSGDNPDFPDTTFITANTGGVVEWRIGESLGGFNLNGGTVVYNGASPGNAQVYAAGTVIGITATASGAFTKNTAGTVTFTGLAAPSGTTALQDGTLVLTAVDNLGANNVTFGTTGAAGTTGTLEYQGVTATRAGTFTFTGPGVVRVTDPTATLTLTGTVAGAGAFRKDGVGSLVLTGGNTQTGAITVAAGSLAGATTLGGTAALTVAAGAQLRAGNEANAATAGGVGTLSTGRPVTFAAGSTFGVRLTGVATAATFDSGTGLVTPGSSTTGTLPAATSNGFLNVTGTGSILFDADMRVVIDGTGVTFTPGTAYSFVVASTAAASGVTMSSSPMTSPVQFSTVGFAADPTSFSLSSDGTRVYVGFTTAVPEPATVGLLAAAGLGVGGRVRRRRGR